MKPMILALTIMVLVGLGIALQSSSGASVPQPPPNDYYCQWTVSTGGTVIQWMPSGFTHAEATAVCEQNQESQVAASTITPVDAVAVPSGTPMCWRESQGVLWQVWDSHMVCDYWKTQS